MKYNFNVYIENENIKDMIKEMFYLYNYDKITIDKIKEYINLYNEVNDTCYKLKELTKDIIYLEEENIFTYIKMELLYNEE